VGYTKTVDLPPKTSPGELLIRTQGLLERNVPRLGPNPRNGDIRLPHQCKQRWEGLTQRALRKPPVLPQSRGGTIVYGVFCPQAKYRFNLIYGVPELGAWSVGINQVVRITEVSAFRDICPHALFPTYSFQIHLTIKKMFMILVSMMRSPPRPLAYTPRPNTSSDIFVSGRLPPRRIWLGAYQKFCVPPYKGGSCSWRAKGGCKGRN
jgi:hypothetical protein